MIVASKKKKENIAEYLLYMWQVEDIIRAYNLDVDLIRQHVVAQYEFESEEQQHEVEEWYGHLIEMMRREEVVQQGHIQINKNVIIDLTDLHLQLLNSTRQPFYTAAFYKTLPYIVELRSKAGNDKVGEIETCFNALYGILMLKLQKREISSETMTAIKQISNLLAVLSEKYKEDRANTLEL